MAVAMLFLVFVLGTVNAECDEETCHYISRGTGSCNNLTEECECSEYEKVSKVVTKVTCIRVFNATEFTRSKVNARLITFLFMILFQLVVLAVVIAIVLIVAYFYNPDVNIEADIEMHRTAMLSRRYV